MPATRARASFEPIAPSLDVRALVEAHDHFQYVDRISCDMIDHQGYDAFDKLVLLHVIKGGKPLIIDGYQARLDEWTFSSKWLQDNHGDKVENARNLTKKDFLPLTIGHYLRNMGKLTDQYFEKEDNYMDKNRQRIYLKDIDCPPVWSEKLREHLPPNLFYLNESTGEIGGPGSSNETAPGLSQRIGRGIAPAGDLMSSLPPAMRAENLMCYIGHEGTYTPAHREMCASMGHNIMVESSEILGTDGKPEKPGSAVWFMTETKDRQLVSEYWLSVLGHDIEVESHFAQIAAWKKAPFTVYVVEQRAGDFLLIPPLAPHQVWNRGTRTMKVAWNRTTAETLEMALEEALPRARQVCRDEQYKNKAIIYYTLHKYHALLSKTRDFMRTAHSPEEQAKLSDSSRIRNLQRDFKKLFHLFTDIMLSEMFAPESPTERNIQFLPFDSNVTCAYCRGNIFNRFLTCSSCDDLLGTDEPEPYDICLECYAMGRSCGCISKLRWVEQFRWKELVQKHENWRRLYVELENGVFTEKSPLPLPEERSRLHKNTLAQICQYQLKRRPWVDVHTEHPDEDLEESDEGDEHVVIGEDGTVKRKKKRRSESWLKNNMTCHVCKHRHPRWKMADCVCGRSWCYGTLFRGHDLMPQQVMERLPDWRCPHCEGVCSAGACRKDPRQKPYEPKGTLLGHDTRAVADVRSVESLVDFSVSNLSWLKEDAQSHTERLRKHQEDASREETQRAEGDEDVAAGTIDYSPDTTVDPALVGDPDGTALADDHVDPALRAISSANSQSISSQGVDPFPDYQPARQTGFIAPTALMYNQPDGEHEVDDTLYADPDQEEILDALGKRPHDGDEDVIKKLTPKRARYDRSLLSKNKSLSGASRQYRKDHERRALEEARRKGRYIQTSAALRGKTKVVKLHISAARLRGLHEQLGRPSIDDDLLRSDLAPPSSAPNGSVAAKPAPTKVRTRERDEDFNNGRHRRAALEEESELSDFDPEEDIEEVSHFDGALEKTDAGDKRRRISSWQQRRAADNVDLSDDESTAKPVSTGRPAGKTTATIRPAVRFNIPSDSDEQENGDGSDHETAATALAQAARQQMQLAVRFENAGGNEDEDEGVNKPVASPSTTANGALKQPRQSITARASRGKKVKIVSGSRRRT